MSGWRGNYIKSFIALIGFALIFAGITSSKLLGEGFNIGSAFLVIGVILLIIVAYWWYKEFQKGA
ncbi:hypothetical protein A2714_04315 [Candidatus Woesebacteria bacterium RIFCSPHIGHO2_01_FULL_38_9]|uniref:Uncharacterized protein n=2 Tax=Candidatus Woeseibacteriota TaxID=1752722 RepID=A0A1F7XY27_9BACT|nr:MAG: hypothetical protein A2714_04315 [Candidatus Woesebacteria bacterium RIFCSPHIGHO2_01_FULL_38_9]OGM58963.1 MAG: hypothetical protein A3A75_00410 [Candidatus Woesebacteria bacterium RIFCSPLOWO2_01_FULL_39_10]